MGFYYGSGQPPQDEEKGGGLREVLAITLVVFRVLALPLGILLGGMFYLFLVFWLFTIHVLLGFAGIGLVVAVVLGRGIWELKHPPEIR
ncbi:MAG TPA: hypothetical protein PKA49_10075 [Tepidiformaceae bacterium]|jgi:hypothetical protein|nr:hypothetical protein [Tepidiformaceae bacterium]